MRYCMRGLQGLTGRTLTAWRQGQIASLSSSARQTDVAIVGAGHNSLITAVLLARQGLKVQVFETHDVVGGACKTEYPFKQAPGLGASTGAYLLGVMPPELIELLGVNIPIKRRDPHYFLPTTGDRYLLFGSDRQQTQAQFLKFFSQQDWDANQKMQDEIGKLVADVAPSWLQAPLSLEETAARHVRPELRETFINLCRRPVADYLDRFGFKSDLVKAMFAVTDGFAGLNGSWESPGSGQNFLVHSMVHATLASPKGRLGLQSGGICSLEDLCVGKAAAWVVQYKRMHPTSRPAPSPLQCRLPGADGTWAVVEGGMGTVTQELARAALAAGAQIHTRCPVAGIDVRHGSASGVTLQDGRQVHAKAVVVGADPFRLRDLAGRQSFDSSWNSWLDGLRKDGTSLKVNLALAGLPIFKCLPEQKGQHNTTVHLLPEEGKVIETIQDSFNAVQAGHLPDFPTIEWYFHTTVDPSLQDKAGHHNSALFVQWVPHDIKDSSWEMEETRYVQHLLRICDRFAPGTSDRVVDVFTLTPPKIEQHFGITRGHIHHIDNSFGFDQRFPYATPVQGLYSASAGTHPGGSVAGAAGHNCAVQVIADLDLRPHWNLQTA